MKKEWFVFKGTQHIGPFSKEEMAELYRNEEINAHTLIWKEGQEKWLTLSHVAELSNLKAQEEPDIQPPPVPPVPVKKTEVIKDEVDDEFPPPIPLDALLDPEGKVRQKIKEEVKVKRRSKVTLVAGAVIFAVVLVWFALTEKNSGIVLRIKGIMPVYLDKLEMTATNNSPKFEVALALSLDSQILWASTNFSSDVETTIDLFSKTGKVLGSEDVQVKVKGKMINHLGKFTKMTLVKGSKFYPGEYRYRVSGKSIHFINQHFHQLSSLDFFKRLNKTYMYESEALIYPGTPREFEKKLFDFNQMSLTLKLRPYTEKLERIKTFESLVNEITQNYLMTLENAKSGASAMAQFEMKFIKEHSPLLQSLVVRANELSLDPEIKKEEQMPGSIAPYQEQVQLGKQIGEMASDMITQTAKIKKLTDKDKKNLRVLFEKRAQNIKLQIELNIRKLEDQIKKIGG